MIKLVNVKSNLIGRKVNLKTITGEQRTFSISGSVSNSGGTWHDFTADGGVTTCGVPYNSSHLAFKND